MSTEFTWLVPKRILYGCAQGRLSPAEIKRDCETVVKQFEQTYAPRLHFIYNMEAVEEVNSVEVIRDQTRNLLDHPKMGWLVVCGVPTSTGTILFKVVSKLFKVRMLFVTTFEDALSTLKKVDPALSDVADIEKPPIPSKEARTAA